MMMPLAKKTTTSHNQTTANFFTLLGKTMTQTEFNIKTSFDSSSDKKKQNNYCIKKFTSVLSLPHDLKERIQDVVCINFGFSQKKYLELSKVKLSKVSQKIMIIPSA